MWRRMCVNKSEENKSEEIFLKNAVLWLSRRDIFHRRMKTKKSNLDSSIGIFPAYNPSTSVWVVVSNGGDKVDSKVRFISSPEPKAEW